MTTICPNPPTHFYLRHCSSTKEAGFTMIELLVVMAIVAIMSLMAAPSYIDRLVRQQIVDAGAN